MIKSLVGLFVISLFLSCSKYDLPKCTFEDATQELPWLKEVIDERTANPSESMKYCYILQAELKKKTVFVLGDCNPAIDKITFVLNCEGTSLREDGRNISVSEVELKNRKIIWEPLDFACDID